MDEKATPTASEQKSGKNSRTTTSNQSNQSLVPSSASTPERSATRWASPFNLARVFMDDLDRVISSIGLIGTTSTSPLARQPGLDWVPTLEVFVRDGKFVIRADVPGLDRDQLKVEIDGDRVVLSGVRVDEQEQQTSDYYRRERSYGRFYRVVPLPEGVDVSQANATFNQGVLAITMPIQERAETRKLEIKDDASSAQSSKQQAAPSDPSKQESAPAH